MSPEAHRARARAIEESLGPLDDTDYETVIDACMLAASQWVNAVLHARGLTPPERDFIHPFFLGPEVRARYDAVLGPALLAASDGVENLRPFFVRGDDPGGPQAAARARAFLAAARAEAGRLLASA